MKLAYLSGSSIPSRYANSVHVMKMCQAFARAGAEVTLYARGPAGQEAEDFAWYGVEPVFGMVKWRKPFFTWNRHRAYTRFVARDVARRPLPDLFYSRRAESLAAVAHLGVPLVFEAHEPPRDAERTRVLQGIFDRPNFVRLVSISHALAREYLRRFPSLEPARIVVAPDGADLPAALPTFAHDRTPGEPLRAGYVGQLYPGKGMETIAALATRMPDVEFSVVGGKESQIARWKRECPSPNLRFHGFVPHGALDEIVERFDVLLAPYLERVTAQGKSDVGEWMSPLKLFEYMAAGRPIVCSDLPVLREVMEDRRNCLLAPPGDPEAWAAALEL
ncbi:MAG: Glycosyltransferase, partial [uncultured Gemmatimonadetes bacterium]